MNRGKLLAIAFSLVPLTLVAQPTPEQIADFQRRWNSHAIGADGDHGPEQIPYAVVVESALRRLAAEKHDSESDFRERLRARFSGTNADLEQIGNLASQNEEFIASVYNEESRKYDEACLELLNADAGTLDAMQVARRFERIKTQRDDSIEMHYRQAIDMLSPSTRSTFMSFVETEVRPHLAWSTMDNIGLALDLPEAFLSHRRLSCESWVKRPTSEKSWASETRPEVVRPVVE